MSDLSINFISSYNKAFEDNILTRSEYDQLKQIYKIETGSSDADFENLYSNSWEIQDAIFEQVSKDISEYLTQAIKDGLITIDEYQQLEETYLKNAGISEDIFNFAIILFLKDTEKQKNPNNGSNNSIKLDDIFRQYISEASYKLYKKLFVDTFLQHDFFEYIYEKNKSEYQQTHSEASQNLNKNRITY